MKQILQIISEWMDLFPKEGVDLSKDYPDFRFYEYEGDTEIHRLRNDRYGATIVCRQSIEVSKISDWLGQLDSRISYQMSSRTSQGNWVQHVISFSFEPNFSSVGTAGLCSAYLGTGDSYSKEVEGVYEKEISVFKSEIQKIVCKFEEAGLDFEFAKEQGIREIMWDMLQIDEMDRPTFEENELLYRLITNEPLGVTGECYKYRDKGSMMFVIDEVGIDWMEFEGTFIDKSSYKGLNELLIDGWVHHLFFKGKKGIKRCQLIQVYEATSYDRLLFGVKKLGIRGAREERVGSQLERRVWPMCFNFNELNQIEDRFFFVEMSQLSVELGVTTR